MTSNDTITYHNLDDLAYDNGYNFAKHLIQPRLDDGLLHYLATYPDALRQYHAKYNEGFEAGIADDSMPLLVI